MGWSLVYDQPFHKLKVQYALRYPGDRQTDKQTDKKTDRQTDRGKNITTGGGNKTLKYTIILGNYAAICKYFV